MKKKCLEILPDKIEGEKEYLYICVLPYNELLYVRAGYELTFKLRSPDSKFGKYSEPLIKSDKGFLLPCSEELRVELEKADDSKINSLERQEPSFLFWDKLSRQKYLFSNYHLYNKGVFPYQLIPYDHYQAYIPLNAVLSHKTYYKPTSSWCLKISEISVYAVDIIEELDYCTWLINYKMA